MQGPKWTDAQREARLDKLIARNRSSHAGAFLYEDAEWMRDAYETRGLTLRAMAAEAGCGLRTIARWMTKHGITTRTDRTTWAARGSDHPGWKAARVCPKCGGQRSHGSKTCLSCRVTVAESNPKWRGEAAEYTAIHYRVVALRGKPSDHPCAQCGGAAQEWAYDHADPHERRNRKGRDDGAYSLDPEHYIPLCVRCHRRFDLGRQHN